jgi:hypothetical protein
MVQGSEGLLPLAPGSSSVWYQALRISAGLVPPMRLIFCWAGDRNVAHDTALIVDHVAGVARSIQAKSNILQSASAHEIRLSSIVADNGMRLARR